MTTSIAGTPVKSAYDVLASIDYASARPDRGREALDITLQVIEAVRVVSRAAELLRDLAGVLPVAGRLAASDVFALQTQLVSVIQDLTGTSRPGSPPSPVAPPTDDGDVWNRAVPVVSTAHVTQETMDGLTSADLPIECAAYEYGVFIYTGEGVESWDPEGWQSLPPDLRQVIEWHWKGAKGPWLNLDASGGQTSALPIFDW